MDLGLHLVILEVTGSCNLFCHHCYCGEEKPKQIMDFELVLKELADVKPHYITISGGEPLLLENIFEIAKELKKLCQKLFLTTNGTLITNYPRQSFTLFDDVQISLEGESSTHDLIRGEGTFVRAVEGARFLSGTVPVSFLCTVNALNYQQLDIFAEFARSLGVVPKIERMSGFGQEGLRPIEDPKIWREVLRKAAELQIFTDDPLDFWFKEKKRSLCRPHRISGGCMAGVALVAISPELEVYPCARLRVSAGSLKERSLREIWLESPFFASLRHWHHLNAPCRYCPYASNCRGCRADAWARSGDYLGPDPLCWLGSAKQ